MNRQGFTLIEMLACLALLGIVLGVGLVSSRGTLSTSLTQFRSISDSEVFEAARTYAVSENITFNNGYACVIVSELIDLGYLEYTNDEDIRERIVQINKNDSTKVIESIKYTQVCGGN